MPIVTYTPEDGEKRSWDFDPGRVKASVAEVIEKRAGCTYANWNDLVQRGDMHARRVLLWFLTWREHPEIRLEDVDFFADELTVELNARELAVTREELATAGLKPGFTEADRAEYLEVLDTELAKLGGSAPKAESENSTGPTGQP